MDHAAILPPNARTPQWASGWYAAVLQRGAANTFSGDLFADKGPWFGGMYDQTTVMERAAGTASFVLNDLNHATLVYTVDSVVVTKQLERLTFRLESFTGNYAGGYSIRSTGCVPSSLDGIQEVAGLLTIAQTGSVFHIGSTDSTGGSCNFNGRHSQFGKLGQVDGNYSCSDGTVGKFAMFEMTPTISGFTGRVSGQNQFCQWSGYMGGIAGAQ